MEPAVLGEYYTVAGTGTAEIVDRRSRFLGAVAPAADEQEAQAFLAEIRRSIGRPGTTYTPMWWKADASAVVPTTANPREQGASRCWTWCRGRS